MKGTKKIIFKSADQKNVWKIKELKWTKVKVKNIGTKMNILKVDQNVKVKITKTKIIFKPLCLICTIEILKDIN